MLELIDRLNLGFSALAVYKFDSCYSYLLSQCIYNYLYSLVLVFFISIKRLLLSYAPPALMGGARA